jgi:hypothetical protein
MLSTISFYYTHVRHTTIDIVVSVLSCDARDLAFDSRSGRFKDISLNKSNFFRIVLGSKKLGAFNPVTGGTGKLGFLPRRKN